MFLLCLPVTGAVAFDLVPLFPSPAPSFWKMLSADNVLLPDTSEDATDLWSPCPVEEPFKKMYPGLVARLNPCDLTCTLMKRVLMSDNTVDRMCVVSNALMNGKDDIYLGCTSVPSVNRCELAFLTLLCVLLFVAVVVMSSLVTRSSVIPSTSTTLPLKLATGV